MEILLLTTYNSDFVENTPCHTPNPQLHGRAKDKGLLNTSLLCIR